MYIILYILALLLGRAGYALADNEYTHNRSYGNERLSIRNCSDGVPTNMSHSEQPPHKTYTKISYSTPIRPSYGSVAVNSTSITTVTQTAMKTTDVAKPISTTRTSSASTCVNTFTQRTQIEENNCVPCEGQNGSLPYCGADVYTDNYKFTPKTCRTVRYTLDITNNTIAPDGRERVVLLVNGQMPGPVIEANWGKYCFLPQQKSPHRD